MNYSKALNILEVKVSKLTANERLTIAALEMLSKTSMANTPSVGIELEFFLRDGPGGALCTLAQSQTFLHSLSELPQWDIFSRNAESGLILKVSKSLDSKRYHTVKYEHPPHMMEVALSYETNLVKLKDSLELLFSELHTAAKNTSLAIDISLKVEPSKIDWDSVREVESRFKPLSDSRKKIFESHTGGNFDHRVDFTHYTAATQFHIGGIRWWEQAPDFIDKIYRAEFLISGLPYYEKPSNFQERWSSYRYVFGEMPLLGFPKISQWSTDEWIGGLLKSPYFEKGFSTFEAAVGGLNDEALKIAILSVRDLQIIKPKWIGTLEYRSDPAIPSVELILRLAALRFGAYLHYLNPKSKPLMPSSTFEQLSTEWWNGAHTTNHEFEWAILKEICFEALSSRGFGEEKFL
ncbi:MAG: hypothetical protein H7333_10940 [Bdellovibrionales bacterium]|nr:hypothetical protein [Oligoflexia bacterium]